jgi:hypothetical protein
MREEVPGMIFKKIEEELGEIKQQLYELMDYVKRDETEDDITIVTFLGGQGHVYTEVHFLLSDRDWCEVEQSDEWKDFQHLLSEYQSAGNRRCRQGRRA